METTASTVSKMVPVTKIRTGNNPRTYFDPAELQQMAASIRAVGVIQPPLVRPIADTDEFEMIAGEKRWRAAIIAELSEIPVFIRSLDDSMAEAAAIIENVHRGNMSAAEEAKAAQKVLFRNAGDKAETALALGWSNEILEKRLAILACAPEVLDALTQRTILLGHAELLAAVPPDKQLKALPRILDGKLSVAELKAAIGKLAHKLSDAIFDPTQCLACPHNSGRQQAMFAEHIGDGYCTKPEHYEELTSQKLEEIASAKRQDYPQVRIYRKEDGFAPLFLTADGPLGVGDEQAQACKSCANYGCAISAVPGSVGHVVAPLCFDAACNQKNVAARIKSEQAAVATTQTDSATASPIASEKRVPAAKSSAKPNALPKAVAAYRVEQWRTMLARELHKQPDKGQSLLIGLALTRNLTYVDQSRFRTALEKSHDDLPKAPSLLDAVEFAHEHIGQGKSESLALMPCAAAYGVPEDALVKLMVFLEVDVAAYWKLNKEFLNCMTKSEVESVADELGLKKAMKATYAKLAGGKKDDFVNALLKVEGIDYTGLVPKVMCYAARKSTKLAASDITQNNSVATAEAALAS
jgi:ParB family transcriptional regulator, chromosome partitioning protein